MRRGAVLALMGALLVVVHAAALPAALRHFARPALRVTVTGPAAAERLSLDARLPAALADRARVTVDGRPVAVSIASDGQASGLAGLDVGPGLHHVRWGVRYRGGFERTVGASQLVGPLQDPARPPCSARAIVAQSLLDDGAAGPGTLAHIVEAAIEEQLDGHEIVGAGGFRDARDVALRWVSRADAPELPDDLDASGLVEARMALRFERATTHVRVALVPLVDGEALRVRTFVDARLELDSRILQWVSDMVGGDRIATSVASRQIDDSLLTTLGPPPPLPLGGGASLHLRMCPDRPLEIRTDAWAALPLAVEIRARSAGGERIVPVDLPPAPEALPPLTAPVALAIDLDTINAILHELWRTGMLDRALDEVDLPGRWAADATVRDLLSVRLSDVSLPLPPTVHHDGTRLRIGAELGLTLRDGDARTAARLYGTAGIDLTGAPAPGVMAAMHLEALALTCHPAPGTLAPCYADLVSNLASRADELHPPLTDALTAVLEDLLIGRTVSPHPQAPRFTVTRSTITSRPHAPNAALLLELDGRLDF